MRKSLIARQVKYFYDLLNLSVTESSSGGYLYKTINNWFYISTALYKLNEYSFVGSSIQDIFALGASFQSSEEKISLLEKNYSAFLIKFDIVKAKCEAIIDSYEIDDDVQDVYIRLPNRLKDLDNFSSIIKDLDLVFNKCPIFSDSIGRVAFKKVEEGSNWIVITIGAVIAGSKILDWVANFIKSCNEIRIQNKTIKSLDLDNIIKEMGIEEKKQEQCKENVIKAEETKIKSLCLESFNQIGITIEKINPEDEARIVHCMKTLADLLDEGVEVYPSVSSNDEIKKLFPLQEEEKLIEDSQKLLGKPQDNDES